MDTKTCLKTRRSVRRFTGEPVSRDLLREAVSLAQYAPSWKNTQTVRYIIVDDPALKNTISEKALMGYQRNINNLSTASAAVLVTTVHGLSGYNEDGTPSTAKGSHWESFDAGLAVQTFCLAAHELGLGTVIMGMFDPEKMKEVLELPAGQEPSCLLAIGYPTEDSHGNAVRKPLEEVLTFK